MTLRLIALLSSLLLAWVSTAQVAQQAPGYYRSILSHEPASANRDIVWSEDFENGIPSGWVNEEAGGIAVWEYRGPLTTPSNNIGTAGSCVAAGAEGGDPINSASWANGFIIFDSNFWDNPDLPCTPDNLGTGTAPGPHLATLTTSSIDLGAQSDVALVFTQYLRFYQGETRVDISINQGAWQTVFENDYGTGASSPLDEVITVPLQGAAGNSDVRLRFVYDGLYYFWQIDDIQIISIFADDIRIADCTYGDFDMTNPDNPTGYEWLEYSQYPDEMAPLLKFSATGINAGADLQTNVLLDVEVRNAETDAVLHTAQSSEGWDIPAANEHELRAGNYQMPSTIAKYEIAYYAHQNEDDEDPDNNRDTLAFRITDVTYARDRGPTTGLYIPSGFDGIPYMVGNVFVMTSDAMQAQSISVGVGLGTSTPSTIYAGIYSIDLSKDIVITPVALTEEIEVTPDMINLFGDEFLMTIPFDTPVALETDVAYLVVAGTNDGPEAVIFATSGASPELSSWVVFNNEIFFYLTQMPIVRLNFGPFVGISESNDAGGILNVFPNPSSEDVYVTSREEGLLSVTDTQGRMVYQTQITSSTGRITLPSSVWAAGVYNVSLACRNGISTHRLIIR